MAIQQQTGNATGASGLPKQSLWFVALIGLPAIGWMGLLDQYSASSLGDSLSSAGIIYATARGINALVSLLQGTELGVVFVTVSIGEVLDPVNDLIERFSQLILVALGSLALQKILLNVVSDVMFNVLLTIAALAAAASLLLGHARSLRPLLKAFLLIVFLRFSLGLVVLANGWVDAHFLAKADAARHQAMEDFRGELREIDKAAQEKAQVENKLEQANLTLNNTMKRRRALQTHLDELDTRIAQARSDLAARMQSADGLCLSWDPLGYCPPDVQQAKQTLTELQEQRIEFETEVTSMNELIQDLQDDIDCLVQRQSGQSCDFLKRVSSTPDVTAIREKLQDFDAGVSEFSDNTINLLVSLLLKTVAIPLLFIYLLILVMRQSWSRL